MLSLFEYMIIATKRKRLNERFECKYCEYKADKIL